MARKPRDAAWLPAIYEAEDVEALQALSKGIADPAQQGRALKWIVETAAETYGLSYRSDGEGGERETAFALGRVFVGQQIVKLVNMAPVLVAQLRKTNG